MAGRGAICPRRNGPRYDDGWDARCHSDDGLVGLVMEGQMMVGLKTCGGTMKEDDDDDGDGETERWWD